MYKRGPWSGDKGLQNVKALFLFCQHASDLQQVYTLPAKNIEIPCVFIADFGQINASFFSKQDMCLSETDTDMPEIATNEARVMSTKNEACNDQLLPGSFKKRRSVDYPPPLNAGARGNKTGDRPGARWWSGTSCCCQSRKQPRLLVEPKHQPLLCTTASKIHVHGWPRCPAKQITTHDLTLSYYYFSSDGK